MSSYLLVAVLVGTGIFSGFLSGLLGVGGGLVVVPAIFFIFSQLNYPAEMVFTVAVATSLTAVIMTTLASAITHFRAGYVDRLLLVGWVPWLAAGSVVGAVLAVIAGGTVLRVFFGIMVFLLGLNMLRVYFNIPFPRPLTRLPFPIGGYKLLSMLIGFFSSWLGIGGGVFNVPLILTTGRTMHHAIGTSSALNIMAALPATIIYLSLQPGVSIPGVNIGYVSVFAVICIIPSALVLAPIGAKASHRMAITKLKLCFSIFLLAVAIRILW